MTNLYRRTVHPCIRTPAHCGYEVIDLLLDRFKNNTTIMPHKG